MSILVNESDFGILEFNKAHSDQVHERFQQSPWRVSLITRSDLVTEHTGNLGIMSFKRRVFLRTESLVKASMQFALLCIFTKIDGGCVRLSWHLSRGHLLAMKDYSVNFAKVFLVDYFFAQCKLLRL